MPPGNTSPDDRGVTVGVRRLSGPAFGERPFSGSFPPTSGGPRAAGAWTSDQCSLRAVAEGWTLPKKSRAL